jgi:hypothetical protein
MIRGLFQMMNITAKKGLEILPCKDPPNILKYSKCQEPNNPDLKLCANPKCGMGLRFLVDAQTI